MPVESKYVIQNSKGDYGFIHVIVKGNKLYDEIRGYLEELPEDFNETFEYISKEDYDIIYNLHHRFAETQDSFYLDQIEAMRDFLVD